MMKKRTEPAKSRRKSQMIEDLSDAIGDNDDVIKPSDQLQLTDTELKEEITKILSANNPHAPSNIVRFNFKESQYKAMPQVDQMAVHFKLDGNMIAKDSDEAKIQLGILDEQPGIVLKNSNEGQRDTLSNKFEDALENEEEAEEDISKLVGDEVEEGDEEDYEQKENVDEEGQEEKKKKTSLEKPVKKLANQFNFCEHATQTYNNPSRDRGNLTEPPLRATYAANVTQWGIYDEYKEDAARKDKLIIKKNTSQKKNEKKKKKRALNTDLLGDDISKFVHPVRIVERMVNQNTFDDVSQDFKYYEDASDDFRESAGTLLPLWKFTYEKSKKLSVTALCWSPRYSDLFAVGLGSYDFLKQVSGMICFYSLKNPGFPEYIYETESGVLCLDVHKDFPYMVCAGFYDGAIGVFKLNQEKTGPLYLSTAKTGKHTDPVWQVRWQNDNPKTNVDFFSVSADGRVSKWSILKTGVGALHECPDDIAHYDSLIMQVQKDLNDDPESSQLSGFECGTAMDFHSVHKHLFLIATEEGMVHKCSKAYSSQYLESIKAHYMAVYQVKWNPFHEDIFITCSADWTVKIWQNGRSDPVFTFDLSNPVGDVAWSPYSSTVFAAVTTDGFVHVYDLSINKYEPLCKQLVVQKKRTKLTHIAFNPVYPIIIVGDDRGQITSLKLSPNLRKKPKEKKGLDKPDPISVEIEKFNTLLALVG